MKRFFFFFFIFLGFSSLLNLANAQDTARNETISPKKFKKLSRKKNTVVIDVRSAVEYESGHIIGASQIDVEQPGFDEQVKELDRSKTYLLYCRSGRRSENAAGKMRALGFTKVYHLQGGIQNWKGKIVQ